MPCSWEGNRRSGVALAMCHRPRWFIHLRARGLGRVMGTPPTLLVDNGPSNFTLTSFDPTLIVFIVKFHVIVVVVMLLAAWWIKMII